MPNATSDPRPDQVSDQVVELPVLWLDDEVILPGMVAPIALDAGTQAAVDAARNAADSRLLIVPRNEGAYASHGVLAIIEQVGRLPQGGQAVVVRGVQRARIGSGVSGAGAALWVQATLVDDSPSTPRTAELAADYRALVISILQLRGAYQVIDTVQRVNDAATLSDLAGYASYLDTEQKLWLLETADVDVRLEKLSEWARVQLAELEVSGRIRDEVREGMEKSAARVLAAPAVGGHSQGARRGRAGRGRRLPRRALRLPTCRRRSGKLRCARSASSSAAVTRAPRRAGSAPGSTPCLNCPGTPARRTAPTSRRLARSSTPTTKVWTT